MQVVLDGGYHAERSVVALGMFDGVHIGHKVLLQKGRMLAKRRNAPLVVCTFMEHPLTLIAPEKCPPLLSTFDERVKLMEALGVDVLYAMPFDRGVMDMPPEDYVGRLVRRFHPTDVVCGYNHTYGRRGKGTPALLGALGDALGFTTAVVPKITLDGGEVSSTAIRALLGKGDVARAARLLGRPFMRQASVVCCDENRFVLRITPNGKQDVPCGSYRAVCANGEKRWPALINVESEGRAACRLPRETQEHAEWTIDFLANAALKF